MLYSLKSSFWAQPSLKGWEVITESIFLCAMIETKWEGWCHEKGYHLGRTLTDQTANWSTCNSARGGRVDVSRSVDAAGVDRDRWALQQQKVDSGQQEAELGLQLKMCKFPTR